MWADLRVGFAKSRRGLGLVRMSSPHSHPMRDGFHPSAGISAIGGSVVVRERSVSQVLRARCIAKNHANSSRSRGVQLAVSSLNVALISSLPPHVAVEPLVRFVALLLRGISGGSLAIARAAGVERVIVGVSAKLSTAVKAVAHFGALGRLTHRMSSPHSQFGQTAATPYP